MNSKFITQNELQDKAILAENIRQNSVIRVGDIVLLQYKSQSGQEELISGDGITNCNLKLAFKKKEQHTNNIILKLQRQEFKDIKQCLFQIKPGKKYSGINLDQLKKDQLKNNQPNQNDFFNLPQILRRKVYPDTFIQSHLEVGQDEGESKKNEQNEQINEGTILTFGKEFQLHHLYSGCSVAVNKKKLAKQEACRQIILQEQDDTYSNFQIKSKRQGKKQGDPVLYGDKICIATQFSPEYYINVDESQDQSNSDDEVNASITPCFLSISCFEGSARNSFSFQEITFRSGDVVQIKSINTEEYLSVRRITKSFNLKHQQQEGEGLYDIYFEKQGYQGQNYWNLWQIEEGEQDYYSELKSGSRCTLKHVLTGLCLYASDSSQKIELKYFLTNPIEINNFEFTFIDLSHQSISQSSRFSIAYQNGGLYKSCHQIIVQDKQLHLSILKDEHSFLFQMKKANEKDHYILSTVKAIQNSLLRVFTFEFQQLKQGSMNQEKIFVSLKQIVRRIAYFLEKPKKEAFDKQEKQMSIADSGIFELLIQVQNKLLICVQKKDLEKQNIVDCLNEIFIILIDVIEDNSYICDNLLNELDESQNIFYWLIDIIMEMENNNVIMLIQSIALYNEIIPKRIIKYLIKKLFLLSQKNLNQQNNLIRILTLLLSDKFGNPRLKYQNTSIKLLFGMSEQNQQFEQLFFQFYQFEGELFFNFFPQIEEQLILQNKIIIEIISEFKDQTKNQSNKHLNFPYKFFSAQTQSENKEYKNEKLVSQYSEYFTNVMLLFSSLCSGRNYQGIEQISTRCKISLEIISKEMMKCFETKIKITFLSAFISLFNNMYLNIDPLILKSTLLDEDKIFLEDMLHKVFFQTIISFQQITMCYETYLFLQLKKIFQIFSIILITNINLIVILF